MQQLGSKICGRGGCGRSPSLTEDGEAQFRGVRGVSPADIVQRCSSCRLRVRRVSLEVLKNMVLARSFCGLLVVVLGLLSLCSLPVRVGQSRRVDVVLLLSDLL